MRKNVVLDRDLKKHEFLMDFDAKMGGPKLLKRVFRISHVAIEEVWVVTKFNEKWMPRLSRKVIGIEPLGAHG